MAKIDKHWFPLSNAQKEPFRRLLKYDPRNHTKQHQEDFYFESFRVISWIAFWAAIVKI